MSKKTQKRTIAIDFDGVLHRYSGYQGGKIDEPVIGAKKAIRDLVTRGHEVVIFTTRDPCMVRTWLCDHNFPARLEVTNVKRPFWLIVDDRAMHFDGCWDGMVDRINAFKPYWHGGNPAPAEDPDNE